MNKSLDHNKCAVFLLSHGRPDRVHTYHQLLRRGWTKPIYIIVDNEDPTVDRYRELFGEERVIMFDKRAIAATFDTADSLDDRRTDVYARNACWDIADELGLDYHWQLDDDYTQFRYRFWSNNVPVQKQIFRLDETAEALMSFLDVSGAKAVAMGQGGDFSNNVGNFTKGIKRKAMNSFMLRRDRRFTFVGRMNNDVNTYIVNGARGDLFLTLLNTEINQLPTQTIAGGISDLYRESGTYVKSFYTVMMAPSAVHIQPMGPTNPRLHHRIKWDYAVPKILNERYRKTTNKTKAKAKTRKEEQ